MNINELVEAADNPAYARIAATMPEDDARILALLFLSLPGIRVPSGYAGAQLGRLIADLEVNSLAKFEMMKRYFTYIPMASEGHREVRMRVLEQEREELVRRGASNGR